MMDDVVHTLDNDFLLGAQQSRKTAAPPTLSESECEEAASSRSNNRKEPNTANRASPVLERWIRVAFWSGGSETRAGAGAAVLAGALAVSVGGSFTPSMAMSTLDSSCRGMLPSSEEKGLGGFSRHISQLVLPVTTGDDVRGSIHSRYTFTADLVLTGLQLHCF